MVGMYKVRVVGVELEEIFWVMAGNWIEANQKAMTEYEIKYRTSPMFAENMKDWEGAL